MMANLKKTALPHRFQPRYPDDDTYCDYPGCNATEGGSIHMVTSNNRIVIERREFIGEVIEGNGSDNMITAAFRIAGEYIADHDDASGVEVGFEYAGRTFIAALRPEGEG